MSIFFYDGLNHQVLIETLIGQNRIPITSTENSYSCCCDFISS